MTEVRPRADIDLESVALLGVGLVREASQAEGRTKVVARLLRDVAAWRSPLACAWSELPERGEILSQLVGQAGEDGLLLATNAVLASSNLAEAVREFEQALGGSTTPLIPTLLRRGETALAQALGTAQGPTAKSMEEVRSVDGLRRLAAGQLARSEFAAARQSLTRAWETAVDGSAQVADDLAQAARMEGEGIVELEALQQAVRTRATPERRARLAAALAAQHRPQDALAALPIDPQTVEEKVAAGVALMELGESDHASTILANAAESALSAVSVQPGWLSRLAQALMEIGETTSAIQIAGAHAKAMPADAPARQRLAEMLEAAGSHEIAASHATVVLALDPNNDEARRTLAMALQANGQAQAALPHWQVLAGTHEGDRATLAECALQAGHAELARGTCAALLESEPDNVPALVTLGRAYMASSEHEKALQFLDKAVTLSPRQAEAWIALADCQAAAGDVSAAGTTLAAAIQATPGNAALLHAYAGWLKHRGRISEALEAAEKSVRIAPTDLRWLAEYGELLLRLGHLDRALPVLQDVLAQRPGSWEASIPLALALEQRGEITKAADVLAAMNDPVPASAAAHFGRILISDSRRGDQRVVDRGIAALELALASGDADPQVGFWYGVAKERAGKQAEAMECYRPYIDVSSAVDPAIRLKAVHGFARCAIAAGQSALALSTLEQARSQFPGSSELLVALSGAYLASELPHEALEIAHKAVDLDPKNSVALGRLSEAASLAGEPDLAFSALESQAALNPQAAEPQLALARLALQAGKTLETRRAIARAVWLGRDLADAVHSAAELLLRMGERTTAHRLLRRAAGLAPNDKSLLRRLAVISDEVRDPHTAQAAWSRLAELEPDDSDVLKHAAQSHWDLGRRSAAIGFWQRALARDPEDGGVDRALATAYLAEGDTSRGLQAYAASMAKSPADPELAFEAGQAAMQHGAYHQAKAALEVAARLSSDRSEPLTRLGECWLMMGNALEARAALEAACDAAPQRAEPHALLASALWIQGDLPAAVAALESARRQSLESPTAAIALAHSAMHLARWADARATLDQAAKSWSDEPTIKREAVRVRVRTAEAAWIFAQVADARTHAPSPDCATDAVYAEVLKLLKGLDPVGQEKVETRALHLRTGLAFEHADAAMFAEAEAIAALDPTGETRESLVIGHLRAHRVPDAARALAGWADMHSASEWSALLFGLTNLDAGQAEPARQALLAAGQNPVLWPLAEFLIGRTWLAVGKVELFTEHASHALVAWPDEPVWHFQLANAYLEQGQADAALPHLHQAVELAPQEGDYRLALARTLRDTGQISQAQGAFSELVQSMPPIGTVWKEAGLCALSNADFPRALPWLERASGLLPSDAECLVGLARSAMHLGRNKDAHDHIQSAFRIAPEDPHVLLAFGEIMARQGKFEKAIQAYDRALRRSPNPLPVKLARSRLLVSVGRAEQAAEELAAVVEAHPERGRGLGRVGRCTGRLGKAGSRHGFRHQSGRACSGKCRAPSCTGSAMPQGRSARSGVERAVPGAGDFSLGPGCLDGARPGL